MTEPQTTTILLVDDEPMILAFVTRCLQGLGHTILTAPDGPTALATIEQNGAPSVVVADMHMPEMDGATLLSNIRQSYPDTVRILLTGYANVEAAVDAVNLGQIFRFLTKPCTPAVLNTAVSAAVEQHRLITSERVLLEQTLHGTLQMLVDVLSLTNSALFGRGTRIRTRAKQLADAVGLGSMWELEVAAMLSQFSYLTLPPDLTKKVHADRPLSKDEATVVSRLPTVTDQLLAHIPRLEVVRAILARYAGRSHLQELPLSAYALPGPDRDRATRAGEILRLAGDFDALETRGHSAAMVLRTLREREDSYSADLLVALAALQTKIAKQMQAQELPLKDLRVGMVLADDLMTAAGSLLVVRGYEFTPAFVARCHNYPSGWLKEPVKVYVRS